MAYIGKTPVIGNFQVCDAISVVNGQAAYTMQVGGVNVSPESANHMLVSLNGILQKPTSSFTVSGSTITFASNLVTGDVIDFIQILGNVLDLGVPSDNTVTTAKLASTSVTAAKLNNDIISGTTALTSEPADTDEFLVSDAGTLKRIDYSLIKGGAGFVQLNKTSIDSGVATVSMDGYFTSDYDFYKVMIVNLRPVGAGNYIPSIRFRRSNSDVTSSNYRSAVQQAYNGGSNHNGDFPSSLINMVKDSSVKGDSEFGFSAEIIFYNPLKSTRYRMINGQGTYQYSTDRWYTCQFGGTDYSSTSALSGFTILNSGGENFDDGEVYLFGIKTS
jgi:hypothetical protein